MWYKLVLVLTLSFFSHIVIAQDKINKIVADNLSEEVEILALGEPNHYDGTINNYRTELIKELVEKKNFKIIAFESNTFEMYHSYKRFLKSKNPQDIFNGIYAQFECQELVALFDFVEEQNKKGDSIIITGFDSNHSGRKTMEYLLPELDKYLATKELLSKEEKKRYYTNLKKSNTVNLKVLFMNGNRIVSELIPPTKKIVASLEKKQNKTQDERFLQQQLKNVIQLRDNRNEEGSMDFWNRRDYYMLDNIEFLKKEYPNQKMILWGASGHFLREPAKVNTTFFKDEKVVVIGNRLKEKYQDKYFLITYSVFSGRKITSFGTVKVKPPKENTLEYVALQKSKEGKTESYLMNFSSQLDIPQTELKGEVSSRILGYQDTEMEIQEVCDAVIFLDNCQPYTKYKEK